MRRGASGANSAAAAEAMLTLDDDYTHVVTSDSNFNESMYFEFHDPESGIAGFLRLANRPNEGRGERTICLYLPDGRLAFGYARPRVTSNEAMNAGGLAVEVVTPLQDVRVRFDGDIRLVMDPATMSDPSAALNSSPQADCRITLQFLALAPAHEQTFEAQGQSFAPHHYEQLAVVTGEVVIGTQRWPVRGHGLRDHSWGPRSWQAPWFYRWLHGSTDRFGFMAAYFGDADGSSRVGGFVFDGAEVHSCDEVEITTQRDDNGFQEHIQLIIAAGGRRWRFEGDALSCVPLRHRSADGEVSTRIVEAAIRWSVTDGDAPASPIHGMAEYLDQIKAGQPVGIRV